MSTTVSIPNVEALIAKHERAGELLEFVRSLQQRKEFYRNAAYQYKADLPGLSAKYANRVDTLTRCVAKYYTKYQQSVQTI